MGAPRRGREEEDPELWVECLRSIKAETQDEQRGEAERCRRCRKELRNPSPLQGIDGWMVEERSGRAG